MPSIQEMKCHKCGAGIEPTFGRFCGCSADRDDTLEVKPLWAGVVIGIVMFGIGLLALYTGGLLTLANVDKAAMVGAAIGLLFGLLMKLRSVIRDRTKKSH